MSEISDRYLSLFDHQLIVEGPILTGDQIDRHIIVHVEHYTGARIRLKKEAVGD